MVINDLMQCAEQNDKSRDRWEIKGTTATLWVDASSVALAPLLEVDDYAVEDACWLGNDEAMYINLAELDPAQKSINLVLAWGMTEVRLMTDS